MEICSVYGEINKDMLIVVVVAKGILHFRFDLIGFLASLN